MPHGDGGLAWIASNGPTQLLLIHGLQGASITAAAEGDQQALTHLRSKAQEYAGSSGVQRLTAEDALRLSALQLSTQSPAQALQLPSGVAEQPAHAMTARWAFSRQCLIQAAREGHVGALQWLRALCHPTDDPGLQLMQHAAAGGHLQVLQYLRSGPTSAAWDTAVSSEAALHRIASSGSSRETLPVLVTMSPPPPPPPAATLSLGRLVHLAGLRVPTLSDAPMAALSRPTLSLE